MESAKAKQIREMFDAESEKVLKAFSKEVELGKLNLQIAEEEQKLEDVMKKLAEAMSKLPPPKLSN